MASVHITANLLAFFPDLAGKDLVVDGQTVGDVIRAVDRIAPGFGFYVCDELGRLRTHVNVFVGQELIADRKRLTDRVEPGSRVHILQALSGG